jgi:two-component system sensor histidine kinase KdpD
MADKVQTDRAFASTSIKKSSARSVRGKPAISFGIVPGRGATRAIWQYLLAFEVVAGVTLAAFLFTPLVGVHATALVYLLAVVVLAVYVRRGPALFAATLSAVAWDYFFVPPVFNLRINSFADGMLLAMYFIVASVLGQLGARIRAQQEDQHQREARAMALYRLAADLNSSTGFDLMVTKSVGQLETVFNASIALLLPDSQDLLKPHAASMFAADGADEPVPLWVLQHGQPAGKFTGNLPHAGAFYVPLATSNGLMGVVGLRFHQPSPPTPDRRNLLDAFCQQIALALDHYRLNEISEKSRLVSESERLSKTLLDSMSHEMRTPLAAIQSATGNLAALGQSNLSDLQLEMLAEIREAADRLDRLVGNVLEATHLESGTVKPKMNDCDVSDLVYLTVSETEKEMARHKVTVRIDSALPLVPMDFVLTQQALSNLLSNAARHTPPGTAVEVAASVENDVLRLVVADHGPGISPAVLPRIFDKFYRAPNAATGGTGLGLSLVKGFVEAQGGHVTADNGANGGMIFTIRLPLRQSSNPPIPLLSLQPNS